MEQDSLCVHWLEHEYKDRWFADPFILDVTECDILLLVEEYRYEAPKGRIALLEVDKASYRLKYLEVVLELDTHISFPAIWRERGNVYVYPESWLSGELSMYEYKCRKCETRSKKVLCKEPMADAVMTEFFGKRQLFSVQENDKLRVYDFNEETGFFELSFVKPFGKATARSAGDFFEYKGSVYRPAQVCMDCYGEAVEIQKVIWDQNENYCFLPQKTLYPSHPSLKTGLHTLNSHKDVAVVDVHGWNHDILLKSIVILKKTLLGSEWKRKKPSDY